MQAQTVRVRPQHARLVAAALAGVVAGAVAIGMGTALDDERPSGAQTRQAGGPAATTDAEDVHRPTLREIQARR